MQLNLKYNEEFDSFSGLVDQKCEILTDPKDITQIIKSSKPTYGFNVRLPEDVEIFIDGEKLGTLSAGDFQIQARDKQYVDSLHMKGNTTFLNISWEEGKENILVSASTIGLEQQESSYVKHYFNLNTDFKLTPQQDLIESQILATV